LEKVTDKGTYRAYGAEKRINDERMEMIRKANIILAEYEENNLVITLRGLYYQFVARGFTGGENSDLMYNKLKSVMKDGRLAGLISWKAIEDLTRNLRGLQTYRSPKSVLEAAKNSYRRDLWISQPWRPEIWVEKDAQAGTVQQIANNLRVDFFACRGYSSLSEQWEAGQRFARYMQKGQRPIVFHLGDHDPSGIHMTEDNRRALTMFAGFPVTVVRIALNMNQIEELSPPPNPTKMSDSRASDYVKQFGMECWEMDALDPRYIQNLIRENVDRIRDPDLWDEELRREVDDKRMLEEMIDGIGQ
jgi:hypothetical protein